MTEGRTNVPNIAKPQEKAYSPNLITSAKARQRDYISKARRNLNAKVLVTTTTVNLFDNLVDCRMLATVVVQCRLEDFVINMDVNAGI